MVHFSTWRLFLISVRSISPIYTLLVCNDKNNSNNSNNFYIKSNIKALVQAVQQHNSAFLPTATSTEKPSLRRSDSSTARATSTERPSLRRTRQERESKKLTTCHTAGSDRIALVLFWRLRRQQRDPFFEGASHQQRERRRQRDPRCERVIK